MTAPSGMLMWGQAGNYDAVFDRSVIATLANNAEGVVNPTKFTADVGLDVRLSAWSAIVDCGDQTSAVIGSNQFATVTPAAGGASARTDVVWADIDVDGGSWSINLRTTTDIVGRLGVELGRITVPANANVATQFTFSVTAKTWNPFPPPAGVKGASGVASVKLANTNNVTVAVKFPTNRFVSFPAVVASSGHGQMFVAVSSVTHDGFNLTLRTYSDAKFSTTVSCPWIAREMV